MKNLTILGLGCIFLGMPGCGSKNTPGPPVPEGRPVIAPPKLVKVDGIVTLDERPITGVLVMFLPKEEKDGRPASGFADATGAFELGTVNPGDGVVPGHYQIVVTQQSEAKSPPAIPAIYSNPEKTPLQCKVERDGQIVKLELKSK